jgi:hypothetical protein
VPEGFKLSSGWLYNWKKRHWVHVTVRHGEAAAADQAGVLLARESVREVVEGYGEENIYNQDESGLFWRQVKGRRQVSKRTNSVLQCPSHAMPPALTSGRFL